MFLQRLFKGMLLYIKKLSWNLWGNYNIILYFSHFFPFFFPKKTPTFLSFICTERFTIWYMTLWCFQKDTCPCDWPPKMIINSINLNFGKKKNLSKFYYMHLLPFCVEKFRINFPYYFVSFNKSFVCIYIDTLDGFFYFWLNLKLIKYYCTSWHSFSNHFFLELYLFMPLHDI